MSKLTTSKSLIRRSDAEVVTNSRPSKDRAAPDGHARWARYCFTNSIVDSNFFQNFTTPSTLTLMKKSVDEETNTNRTTSRCMYDFSYI